MAHTSLSRYFATEEGASRLREAEQELEAERTRLEAEPNARVAPAGERALTPLTPVRTSQEVAAELAELKAYEEKSAAARRRRKAELERELHEASQRKSVHTQAAATNAAAYVEQLEAAYQHAFAAIETLVTAIERVHGLRDQEGTWKEGHKLGVAPKRPEPWHVRAAHGGELRQLSKRFRRALESRW